MAKEPDHRWAIDSIEAGTARVEEDGERIISIPAYLLPAGVTEGQLLRVTRAAGQSKDAVVVTIAVDATGTRDALATSRSAMANAMKASRKRDPGGDVSL